MHPQIPAKLLKFLGTALLALITVSANAAFVQDRDLISLHYDHAPDRDDGHATVAALAVVRSLGIQPHVVSGAYGQKNSSQYQQPAEIVMTETWGNNWVNAHGNWQTAVNTTTSTWLATLDAGGDIWVAEGGQSDFTADVLRQIQTLRPAIDTKTRVYVVQHSIWNEQQASQTDLNYTRANTNYEKIEDGNGANSTADLNQKSPAFVSQARASQYGDAWAAAFNYLSPDRKLDFSDTVELLHILGIGKNTIATVNDFAAVYLSATPVVDTIAEPNSPTVWSDSYSVNGQCHCDSTYDHGLSAMTVDTPDGVKTVPQVCADITSRLGVGDFDNRVYYNTVQCGFGPANNAADEASCPGIPRAAGNYTGYRCEQTGASWNLDLIYPPAPVENTNNTEQPTQENPVTQSPTENTTENTTETTTEATTTETVTPVVAEFPQCSESVTDPDGDGYGWENNQTCTIVTVSPTENTTGNTTENTTETTTEVTTTETVTPVVAEFPQCSESVTDPDGDGYGWENNQTCTIVTVAPTENTTGNTTENTTGTATTEATTTETVTPVAAEFPQCSESVTDPDGDGYGWENNQTCITAPQTSDASTTQTDDSTTTVVDTSTFLNYFPACSTSVSDDNADGFGWENNQTCVVVGNTTTEVTPTTSTPVSESTNSTSPTTSTSSNELLNFFPACSATVIDPDSDGYGWENNQTCVVITPSTTEITPNTSTQVPETNTTTTTSNELLNFFPACSDTVIDPDNDGYGWENNQTCVVVSPTTTEVTPNTSTPVPETTTSTSNELLNFFPACSATVIDPDSDGYGWENNQTCVVISPTTTEVTPNTNTPVPETTTNTNNELLNFFPACSATVIDPDSDGYGWENNQTCVVINPTTTEVTPNTSTPVPETTTNTNNELLNFFPACSATVIDPDSDGYGWENNQTCVVVSNTTQTPQTTTPVTETTTTATNSNDLLNYFPACTTTAVDPDGDGYAWENNSTCVILNNPTATTTENTTDASNTSLPDSGTGSIPADIAELLNYFPACSNSSQDPDGDGYAWENNQTCVIVHTTSSTIVEFPLCSSAVTDHDNDGYGWENNQTCRFESANQ